MKRLILTLLMVSLTVTAYSQIRPVGAPVLVFDDLNLSLSHPTPSPGSDKIALTGVGFDGIWVMNADGSDLKQVTTDQNAGFGMRWSADNATILSRVSVNDGPRRNFAVKIFNIETDEAEYISEYRPQLRTTPVFDANESNVLLADGRSVERLTLPLLRSTPQIASRLRPVAHASGNKIVLSQLNSDVIREFSPINDRAVYMNAASSPDGSKIAFEVYGGGLHILDVTTGSSLHVGNGYQPSWSPDGAYVVYMRNQDDGYVFTYSEIVAVSVDGTDQAVLYGSSDNIPMNPKWDFNNNRIYFDYYNSGSILYLEVAY
jgi:Tol biopolymer transport system component